MTDIKTKPPTNKTHVEQIADVMPVVDLQARRIRWQTGVSDATARNIAHLAFGGGC